MQQTYEDFIDQIKNKQIMFCGLGKSNMPFLKMLAHEKLDIIAYDKNPGEKFDEETLQILSSHKNIQNYLGDESAWDLHPDILIRTPGMSFFNKKITAMINSGVTVTSEMEIFFELCPCPIIGITGSDGKTTVTTIISEILKREGKKVHVGGNIGKPLISEIKNISKNDVAVVELSSFQLMSMRRSPDIAVVTNISPNHLDIHSCMEEYITAKKQIFLHQNAFSKVILNFDNETTRNFKSEVRGETIFFSTNNKLNNGVWADKGGNIIESKDGKNEVIINVKDIKIPGKHNVENYLAAIACVKDMVSKKSIMETAKNFGGVEHRIEFVQEISGIKFYNDSIASTPNRTIGGALSLFDGAITLIAGGYDKKLPFDKLAEKILEKVSVLILLGNTSEKIEKAILSSPNYAHSKTKIIKVNSMSEAVAKAYECSKPGSAAVLSPACASFDLYKNFEERGRDFKKEVAKL